MPQITQLEDKAILRLDQDLVAASVPEVKQQLKDLVNQGKPVAVDLEGVSMVDSTGIGLLMATHNSLQKDGHALEVLNASDDIVKLFQTMRLDKRFAMS